jgi:hypothetical protein
VDIVLGVSMAPTAVRMVLVEGENAEGATVDEDDFEVIAAEGSATSSAPDRVLAAILGTREGAAKDNFQLTSTGVTWTDPHEAAALRDALAAHKVENVMLVSSFLAAAALAQAAGSAAGYAHTGLLFLEPDTVTLAVVDSADGSVVNVRRQPMHGAHASVDVADMVAWLEALESPLDGVFIVGSGVDTARIKPQVEMATALPVSGPEEPGTALARGAALASAHAPLFVSSTAALAYAQVPDWTTAGVVDPLAVTPGIADGGSVDQDLDYDAAATDLDFHIDHFDEVEVGHGRKPFLVALGVMTIFFVGVLALVISLAISIRPTADRRPSATGNLIVPAKQAPAPAPNAAVQAPPPVPPPLQGTSPVAREVQPIPAVVVPAPGPAASAPPPLVAVPAPAPAPPVVAVAPAAPVPAPVPEAPAPVFAPEAPAPAPVAPVPVPIPVEVPGLPILPRIFNPPVQEPPNLGGGEHHAGGFPGGGGFGGDHGGFPGGGGGGWPGGGGFGGDHGGGFGGFGGDRGGFGGDHGGFGGFGGDHGGFGGFGGDHGGGFGGFGGRGFGTHGGGRR